jgi:hypothetical protein
MFSNHPSLIVEATEEVKDGEEVREVMMNLWKEAGI